MSTHSATLPLPWWSASHATLCAVTTQSAKPFHRLLVHTTSSTPGICKVNKNTVTIISPLFTNLLHIQPKCLKPLWRALQWHMGPEGGKTRSELTLHHLEAVCFSLVLHLTTKTHSIIHREQWGITTNTNTSPVSTSSSLLFFFLLYPSALLKNTPLPCY